MKRYNQSLQYDLALKACNSVINGYKPVFVQNTMESLITIAHTYEYEEYYIGRTPIVDQLFLYIGVHGAFKNESRRIGSYVISSN